MTLERFRDRFDRRFTSDVRQRVIAAKRITSQEDVRATLDQTLRIVAAGGKRIRPYLASLMYRGVGGRASASMFHDISALELFHAFALIHDDVMDRGVRRHGEATIHAAAARRFRRDPDASHDGEAMAILAGDLLLQWAQEIATATPAYPVFARMSEEVIVGQMLDVALAARGTATSRLVETKMRLKTAGYTFVRPMQYGAMLAGTSARVERWCERFGHALGVAFQIQDDLFDVMASSSRTGKTSFSDLAEHQQTFMTQWIMDHGSRNDRRVLLSLTGRTLSMIQQRRARDLFGRSGAVEAAERRIRRLAASAIASIPDAPVRPETKKELALLVETVVRRRA